ncbi:arginyl-tRNA synthetase [Spiroplasma mirum ATCC 29335]|uniref:Arginine--tRNA ligase n=1 Tax=Spiroplasma mirum ATCC 29335 TaxID=838561 RepID=W0GRK5_9MOLU|nr:MULTISPECIES: arginine--tRNA ligase [Spiroplasma]AHF61264.1 putative arginyl-tRNA synthetase [Spiroplasma mirum ATCC 29335]AHI58365.1 arginyl-tRNA synthetase [Spiroplasma mirum ATCC 29335]AKM53327.1 arginyl-tRNA synthetase [Spiroplasma atrichopogonis]
MNNNIKIVEDLLTSYLASKNLEKEIIIEKPRQEGFGHLSTNLALLLAKDLKANPREIANEIISFIKEKDQQSFKEISLAGPGFINFTFTNEQLHKIMADVLTLKTNYGKSQPKNYTYNLEIVSANPTGFLHIGHARNGAIGDSVARILRFAGFNVQTEYYVNDAGNQINILAITVFTCYQTLLGKEVPTPEEAYKGDMYFDVAQKFVDKYQDKYVDLTYGEDYKMSDPVAHKIFRNESVELFLDIIKEQLKLFRVDIEYYSSEKAIYAGGKIDAVLEQYDKLGKTYHKDGALWLKTTDFGDEKDRVLVKNNGDYSYITPDLAVHNERLQRSKADHLVNFWGGDHHGYIIRMLVGLELLGYPKDILEIDMIQMVRLLKDGQEYKMSKRKGSAVWLIDLIEEIGVDPIRYMLSSKTPQSHMDLDVGLLKEYSSKNPVYYAQYATARCNSVLKQAAANNISFDDIISFELLTTDKELNLLNDIDLFNRYVEYSAKMRQPHLICDYIQNITRQFHSYYNEFKVINLENLALTKQRLCFIQVVYQVLSNAFNLIGVDVMEKM